MSSWDDLYDLIRQVERTLFRLKMDQSAPAREVLRDEEAGWYPRGTSSSVCPLRSPARARPAARLGSHYFAPSPAPN